MVLYLSNLRQSSKEEIISKDFDPNEVETKSKLKGKTDRLENNFRRYQSLESHKEFVYQFILRVPFIPASK